MSDQTRKPGTVQIIQGIISLVVGLAIFLWAKGHSPNMGLDQMLTNMNSYFIKQPIYNIILLICALLGINGVIRIVRGLQAGQMKD